MNRREFIATSAVALAAPAFATSPLPVAHSPLPGPRTLRKAVMIGMVGEGATLKDKFQILKDCGFEGAELDSPSDTPADEVLSAMDKTGLKVHGLVDSVHWHYHLNDPDEGARAKPSRPSRPPCATARSTAASRSSLSLPSSTTSSLTTRPGR